jgi:hypothetical protein
MTTFVQFGPDGTGQRLLRGPIAAPEGFQHVDVPLGTPVHAIRRLADGSVVVVDPPARMPPPFEE